jgi:hypothetical protein
MGFLPFGRESIMRGKEVACGRFMALTGRCGKEGCTAGRDGGEDGQRGRGCCKLRKRVANRHMPFFTRTAVFSETRGLVQRAVQRDIQMYRQYK